MNLIGDVKGKVAVMVDDMIDTAGESCIWLQFVTYFFLNTYYFTLHVKVVDYTFHQEIEAWSVINCMFV